MRNEEKRRGGALLLAIGILLLLAGGAVLLSVPDALQYALPAPTGEDALKTLYKEGTEQLDAMSDTLTRSAVCARRQGATLSAADGGSASCTVTVYAVGAGYFDVRHETLREGRYISETDVKQAARVIVISDAAAISMFPGIDPLGQKAQIDGVTYEIVGVVRGGKRVGEADSQNAFMPITTASEENLAAQTVELIARAKGDVSAAILMEDTLRAWKGGGSFYSIGKCKLGAVMPLRWLLLIAGVLLLLALLRRLNALVWASICRFAVQLQSRYAIQLLPRMVLCGALALLGYAALAGAAFALASFSVQPLLVFAEWVPEVIVELSSLSSRFWSLSAAGASSVRCLTREACVVELGAGLIRWGLMAALLGAAVRGIPWVNRRIRLPRLDLSR